MLSLLQSSGALLHLKEQRQRARSRSYLDPGEWKAAELDIIDDMKGTATKADSAKDVDVVIYALYFTTYACPTLDFQLLYKFNGL